MKNILFVCTGNTCRSPMAEGLFNFMAKERGLNASARSAGLFVFPGSTVSENSVRALSELDIDISGHTPTQLDLDLIGWADLILTMSGSHKNAVCSAAPGAKGKTYTLGECAGDGGEIPDPFGGDPETYKKCMLEIKDGIGKVIAALEKPERENDENTI